MVKEGPVGPGLALTEGTRVTRPRLSPRSSAVTTTFAANPEQCAEEGLKTGRSLSADLFFAGPAFAAGRYGVACGAMCKAVGGEAGHSRHHRDV